MKLLSKAIHDFSFSDIVSFCETKQVEGIQLDYKLTISSKKEGLPKHFAAFSNSRGGVIIIGVEEDEKTGLPKSWHGVVVDNKLMEQISQSAAFVDPIPNYEIACTDAVGGKQFVLIRIYEGLNTPYYVQNDAHLYVRTGNVTKLIDDAKPDVVELLYGKRQKAQDSRKGLIHLADRIFDGHMSQAFVHSDQAIHHPGEHRACTNILGEVGALIIPAYPNRVLTRPRELMDFATKNPYTYGPTCFPMPGLKPTPNGCTYCYSNSKTTQFWSEQVFAQGLASFAMPTQHQAHYKEKVVDLGLVTRRLIMMLRWANRLYKHVEYQGALHGRITLAAVRGSTVIHVGGSEYGQSRTVLDRYHWEFETDTKGLRSLEWFADLVERLSWDLGIDGEVDTIVQTLLQDMHNN